MQAIFCIDLKLSPTCIPFKIYHIIYTLFLQIIRFKHNILLLYSKQHTFTIVQNHILHTKCMDKLTLSILILHIQHIAYIHKSL